MGRRPGGTNKPKDEALRHDAWLANHPLDDELEQVVEDQDEPTEDENEEWPDVTTVFHERIAARQRERDRAAILADLQARGITPHKNGFTRPDVAKDLDPPIPKTPITARKKEEFSSHDEEVLRELVREPPREQAEALTSNIELLEAGLSTNVESENSIKSVSKELFTNNDISMKTDITDDEVRGFTKLDFLAMRCHLKNMEGLKNSFLSLRVSRNRKSRGEFIDALNTERRQQQQNALQRMFSGPGK